MTTEANRLEEMKRRFGAGHFADVPGARLHYARMGEEGPPLILLHGWPEFWLTWYRNMPALAERYRVFAPDIRGFGESRSHDRPAHAALTPDIIAADLVALMDALEIERAGFVAHDVGANAMQCFARLYPERVAALFFFNCPYPGIGRRWADADSIPEIWYQTFNQLSLAKALVGYNRDTVALYIGWVLSHWSHDPACFAEDVELWIENFSAPGALEGGFAWYKGIDAARRAMIRDGPPTDLSPIDAPTRILWGKSDKVLRPEWVDRLGDWFSDVRVDIQPNAGHFVHYEQAEMANREMLRFFQASLA